MMTKTMKQIKDDKTSQRMMKQVKDDETSQR